MTASSIRLDYFYGSEVKTGTFFRVPKVFEAHAVYSAASIEVKYLYGVMLDRVSISARNGWLDDGRVFIYFTVEEVKKCIRAGKNKAVQALHDMETLGLIQRKKQGQGKPARIFLKNIIEEKTELSNHDVTESAVPAGNVEAAAEIPTADEISAKVSASTETVDENSAMVPEAAANDCGQVENAVTSAHAASSEPSVAQDEKWDVPAPARVFDSDTNSDSGSTGMPFSWNRVTPSLLDRVDNAPMFEEECVQNCAPAFRDKCALDSPNPAVQTACGGTSRSPETGSQDFPNQASNYNNKNKTDSNNINLSPPAPSPRRIVLPPATREEIEEDKRECREFVKRSIGYEILIREYPGDVRTINGYVELITEALCDEGPYIRIGQHEYSVYEVRERLYQLSNEHICYVLDCMKNTSTKIINMRAYTLTALLNAPLTVDQYYDNLVNQDYAEERNSYGYGYNNGYGYNGYSRPRYAYGRRTG